MYVMHQDLIEYLSIVVVKGLQVWFSTSPYKSDA